MVYIFKVLKEKKLPNKNILASKAFFHKWGTFALGQTKAKSVTTTFKLKDLKGEIDNNTRVAGNLIFHLQQWIDQSYIKKKKNLDLNHTLDQKDLTNIYEIFHSIAAEYTLLKHTQNILQDSSYDRSQNKS